MDIRSTHIDKPADCTPCPCRSGMLYGNCCAPLHRGEVQAQSALALMRSRYSAFALGGLGDYLLRTWHPDAPETSRLTAAELSLRDVDWQGLDIISEAEKGNNATIEFRAYFTLPTQQGTLPNKSSLHERSRFIKEQGRWYYVDGTIMDESKQSARTGKITRNAPCPCGSGKKYKRCCGT